MDIGKGRAQKVVLSSSTTLSSFGLDTSKMRSSGCNYFTEQSSRSNYFTEQSRCTGPSSGLSQASGRLY